MTSEKMPGEIHLALKRESEQFEFFYRWLTESMPPIFFKEVSSEWISLIVHSLVGFREQDYLAALHVKHAAIVLCIDSPDVDIQILRNYPKYGIKNYTTYLSRKPLPSSNNETFILRVATILFTEGIEPLESHSSEISERLQIQIKKKHLDWGEEKCRSLFDLMNVRFLRILPEKQQLVALELLERALKSDHCQYEVQYQPQWKEQGAYSMHLILAWKNVPKHNFLYRLARVVFRHNLVMRRVSATYLNPYQSDSIFLLSLSLHAADQTKAAWDVADIPDFLQEVVSLKFFGSEDLIDATFVTTSLLSGNLGNFLRAMMHFIHQTLLHADVNLYSLENIEEALCHHPELTLNLCQLFELKFHPARLDLEKYKEVQTLFVMHVAQLDTGDDYQDLKRKNILLQGFNFIEHLLKTNFFCANKIAFSFRLDPTYLNDLPYEREKLFPEIPYGIFFFKGMHFAGFHIRFQDLSRGGLRTIFPEKRERMLAERNVVFSECYNLAYTQHKKNKDIPEGGAKGVIFLKPNDRIASETAILARELESQKMNPKAIEKKLEEFVSTQKIEYLYQTQRAYIDSFLTLINCDDSGALRNTQIIDYWKKPEYIYLGPDENLHDQMIRWIAQESVRVGYRPKGAFISGKPEIGINHKEYGVTSLGVNVYMHEVLRYLDIDPTQTPFTVKMTGGPDGDVAGNQILNLFHHYPKTAKLIALTDISGTIFDPQGLNLVTCAQLFHEGKSIRFYPPSQLNPGGFLLDRQTHHEPSPYVQQTLLWRNIEGKAISEWISGNEMNALFRNNVHQTPADIFLPCGGRPRTLHDKNYTDFCDKEGKPTAKAIVEGANLYFSTWARSYLEERGAIIIKDSSANKGGVICSSFEILCSLTLTDEEFIKEKPQLVKEILEIIKECALNEAQLLLQTHASNKKPLTEISEIISHRIYHFATQILNYLEPQDLYDADPIYLKLFFQYCPATLRNKYHNQLLKAIPENHKKAIIAIYIASRLVYRLGLDWSPSLIDILPVVLNDPSLF